MHIALYPPNVERNAAFPDRLRPEQICSSCLKPLKLKLVEAQRTEAWYGQFGVNACECAIFLCAACEGRMHTVQPVLQ